MALRFVAGSWIAKSLPPGFDATKVAVLDPANAKALAAKMGKSVIERQVTVLNGRTAIVLTLQSIVFKNRKLLVTRGVEVGLMPVVSGDRRHVKVKVIEDAVGKTGRARQEKAVDMIPDFGMLVVPSVSKSKDGNRRVLLVSVEILIAEELRDRLKRRGRKITRSRQTPFAPSRELAQWTHQQIRRSAR